MNDEDTTLFDTVQKGFQKVSEQPQQAGEATGSLSDAGEGNRTTSQIQGSHAQR